ncbi:hypothetical protein [Streptosporangium sandarakinum]|uniref:hypothetical protein n=1 Tax=Streptosporangium sandarakinum TaxID=1260955 RepID=UPI0036B6DB5D
MVKRTASPAALSRVQACALLLSPPAGQPAWTVLVVTNDATVATASPEGFLAAGTGRAVLTRADLIDAGVRVVAGSGGRLAAGSVAVLDALLRDVNAHLAPTWTPPDWEVDPDPENEYGLGFEGSLEACTHWTKKLMKGKTFSG